MKLSMTLSLYLAKNYIMNLLALLAGLMALVYFFDTLELLRRASKFDVPFSLILEMSLYKLPEVTQALLPFAVLFSAIYTFWHLTQKLELIIVRTSGFSAFHFLTPILLVSILAGILHMSVLNPISAYMISHYEKLESIHLKRQKNNIRIFENGLWLKQDIDNGYVIFHSKKIDNINWKLLEISGFFFDPDRNLQMRMDAPEGLLTAGAWQFDTALLHTNDRRNEQRLNFTVPTYLTPQDVEDSFASIETIPFWSMPSHINILEKSGFDTLKMKVHYNALLAQPLLFAAMVLIAAGVSMRLPRSGSALAYISTGLFVGLILFFLSNFMQAMGTSQQIPVILASWSTALLSLLCGTALILHIEEK